MPPCLIACDVFRNALDSMGIQQRYPELTVCYLPAYLHLQPAELKRRILAEISLAKERRQRVGCLYGHCFEDIDEVLIEAKVPRLLIGHCFESLLGKDRYHHLIQDQTGTFFMEKELVEHFETYCWEPLELHDPQLRRWYFEHYRQVAYIRQPGDPDLSSKAREIAKSLELELQVIKADYRELDRALSRLIRELYTA
jgi:hypothetical protein